MAKSNSLTAAELKDLEAAGYVEGNPSTIPENINPAIKAKLLEQWASDNGIENPATDLPDANYRQNELVRERVAAEEEGVAVAGRQNEAASGAAKPFAGKGDHDANGKTGGAKKA